MQGQRNGKRRREKTLKVYEMRASERSKMNEVVVERDSSDSACLRVECVME